MSKKSVQSGNRKRVELDREAVVKMYLLPSSTKDVALAFGANQETVRLRLIAWGIPRHPQKNLPRPQPSKARKMESNGFWKGGRIVDKSGYVRLKMNGHPDANYLGYVAEHRLVMERKIGRPLSKHEVVHHVNGDRQDNRPENLELFASNADHLAATLRGKCPQWSEEGYQRMRENGRRQGDKRAAILEGLRAYARMHNESPDRFLRSLSKEQRSLLEKALWLGRLEPLVELEKERESICRDWLVLQSERVRRYHAKK